jgi:hypothetical protein
MKRREFLATGPWERVVASAAAEGPAIAADRGGPEGAVRQGGAIP